MKQISAILLSLLLTLTISAQGIDSTKFAALGLKLAEYYDAMKHESLSVQAAECDFLIETATDSVIRQFIAQNIYEHFSASPVMGSENIAVHVFDKWFADGNLAMESPDAYAEARTYADFNRLSLIGCRAPALELERPDGTVENIFGYDTGYGNGVTEGHGNHIRKGKDNGVVKGNDAARLSVLFFYDADCSKCKLQIRLLNVLFSEKNYPVDMYAVYVGDDRQRWTEIFANEFVALFQSKFPDMPQVMVHHFWDPSLVSDFQRKYGVTQTPRMFLIDPDGTIVGRGLDAVALETMLDRLLTPKEMAYGGKESEELFDGIFAGYRGRLSMESVKGIADYIHDKTLAVGDVLMFKQLSGDYLYYLSIRNGEGVKEGMRYHIDKNILSQDCVWTSSDDSLKVVGYARIMNDLLAKALPGTHVPSLKVPGELYSYKGGKDVSRKLDKIGRKQNIIIFYTEGCEICAAEKAAALKHVTRTTSVFMVNIDALMSSDPALASRLMDAFDLSSLPYVIITDRKGVVQRRYVSLSDF